MKEKIRREILLVLEDTWLLTVTVISLAISVLIVLCLIILREQVVYSAAIPQNNIEAAQVEAIVSQSVDNVENESSSLLMSAEVQSPIQMAEFSPVLEPPAPTAVPITPQMPAPTPAPISGPKRVVVDLSDQRTYAYRGDQVVFDFTASTGRAGSETAIGEYEILDKIPMAYASTWNLDMPFWLGIYWAGPLENGFHGCPPNVQRA